MDVVLLDCVFPEAPRPAYKRVGAAKAVSYPCVCRKTLTFSNRSPARLPSLFFCFGDLARVKQIARRHRRYVEMSSSSSAASASLADLSSKDTLSDLVATELQPGHTVEFGTSRISSVRVQEMQQLGYFGDGVRRVPGAEEIPEPKGELVVFEAFFIAGLRLPAHRFVSEVMRRFDVQVHQLTPNVVVALAKYVWVVSRSWRSSPRTIVCTSKRGKLEIRLHNLDCAPSRRGLERLRWKSWK
jgi:hypothetical protein